MRERIDRFVDAGSFYEQGPIAGHAERDESGQLTRLHGRELRARPRARRRPTLRRRRRGLHAARRLADPRRPPQERVRRDARGAAAASADPLSRRWRRQRDGLRREARRRHAARAAAGRARLRCPSLPIAHAGDGDRAGGLRGARGRRGLSRRAARRLPLLGDDADHVAGADRRPRAGGAGDRRAAHEGRARRRESPRPERRGRHRGSGRRRRARPDSALPLVPPDERLGAARRAAPCERRPRPRATRRCSRSSRASGARCTTRSSRRRVSTLGSFFELGARPRPLADRRRWRGSPAIPSASGRTTRSSTRAR